MFNTGLLVLTRPLPVLRQHVSSLLSNAANCVSSTLYVHLQPRTTASQPSEFIVTKVPCDIDIKRFITELYSSSTAVCKHLDIHILLGNITNNPEFPWDSSYNLRKSYEVVLFDEPAAVGDISSTAFVNLLSKHFSCSRNDSSNFKIKILNDNEVGLNFVSASSTETKGNFIYCMIVSIILLCGSYMISKTFLI